MGFREFGVWDWEILGSGIPISRDWGPGIRGWGSVFCCRVQDSRFRVCLVVVMVVAAAVRVVVCLLFCYVLLPQADYSGAAFTFYAERRKPGSLSWSWGIHATGGQHSLNLGVGVGFLFSQAPSLTGSLACLYWALEYHTLILFFLKEPL